MKYLQSLFANDASARRSADDLRKGERFSINTRTACLLLVWLLLAALWPAQMLDAQTVPAFRRGAPPHPGITTATSSVTHKIAASLRSRLTSGRLQGEIDVVVRAAAGTDLSAFFTRHMRRSFVDPTGSQAYVGALPANAVFKVASLPEVSFIQPLEPVVQQPPVTDYLWTRPPPDREAIQDRLAAARNEEATQETAPQEEVEPASSAADVVSAPVPHGAEAVWARQYTGAGVKVLINDSGIDFAHPDLHNTWARVETPQSPYYGWPLMFDSWSMLLAARDYYLGDDTIAQGLANYADTSFVPEVTPNDDGTLSAVYQPIGAESPITYTLPATSRSGIYKMGSHPDKTLEFWWYGHRVAVLVVDEHEPGIYDTVYVDINNTYDFTDVKPARKGDELIYWDMDGDGYPDVSGGLVYWISDGVNPIPASDWLWGLPGDLYASGDLVAFVVQDFTGPGGDHGQGAAGTVAARGMLGAEAPRTDSIQAGVGTRQFDGPVRGAAPDARLVSAGNFYVTPFFEDPFLFAALGYDGQPSSGDDSQIITNAWSLSNLPHGGWDPISRQIDAIVRSLSPTLTVLKAAGSGGPGYGTVLDHPAVSMVIGASTRSIGHSQDSATSDVLSWSARGPSAWGSVGIDVVAQGNFSSGLLPLNMFGNGKRAVDGYWGGVGRAVSTAAGNIALIYQAFKETHGRWPTFAEVHTIVKSSADNLHHDAFSMGAGQLNAERAVDLVTGRAGFQIRPATWRVGDYQGEERASFAHIVTPGQENSQTFQLHNPTAQAMELEVRPVRLVRTGWETISTEFNFTGRNATGQRATELLLEVTDHIPPGTDLLEAHVVLPMWALDADNDYTAENAWRLFVYTKGNGDQAASEQQSGREDETYYILNYSHNVGTTLAARIARPTERAPNGVFLGIQHSLQSERAVSVPLQIQLTFYTYAPWRWVTLDRQQVRVPAQGNAAVHAQLVTPPHTTPGAYQGAILITSENHESHVPVVVNVAAASPNFTFGWPDTSRGPYDNSRVFGHFDWRGRHEAGDWRTFFVDVPQRPTSGTTLLIETRWRHGQTDLDTIVLGPVSDCLTNQQSCPKLSDNLSEPEIVYGPFTLTPRASSQDTYIGNGRYVWQSSTGEPRELIGATLAPGLHAIRVHNVLFAGAAPWETLFGQVSTLRPSMQNYQLVTMGTEGGFEFSITSSAPVAELQTRGYGLIQPEVLSAQIIRQDIAQNPATASYTRTISISDAARLDVRIGNSVGNDLDLYLYQIIEAEQTLVAASTTPGDEEFITIQFPADGDYLLAVHGHSLIRDTARFDLEIRRYQGNDLIVNALSPGPYRRDVPIHFAAQWTKDIGPDESAEGLIFIGPPAVPNAVEIPVQITRDYPRTARAVVTPSHDTYLHGMAGADIKGARPTMWVGQNDTLRGVIQFTPEGISPLYPIDRATLRLYMADGRGRSEPAFLFVYQLQRQFDESTATWEYPWTTPGALPEDSAILPIARRIVSTAEVEDWVEFDVTRLVTHAITVGQPIGLLLQLNPDSDIRLGFATKEYANPDHWPQLEINYRTP